MSQTTPTTPAAVETTAAILPLGQDGVVVRFGDGYRANSSQALAFADQVRAADISGAIEVATSLTSVLVRFAPAMVARAALTDRLQTLLDDPNADMAPPGQRRLWTIPVSFGDAFGPQLAEAAALADLTPEAAIADIVGQDLSVLAIGFAPGQPYLGHLAQHWDLPRQANLTPHVPAGALVVALRQLVLFANPSPTGWRWIGTCAFAPFKADRADPFALRANDRIRFVAVDADTITRLRADTSDGLGGAVCEPLT